MAQVTIYLPPEVEGRVRREAKRHRKSLSAYIATLLVEPPKRQGLARHYGACPDLKLPDDRDLAGLRDIDLEP